MNILGIDSATQVNTVALLSNGKLLAEIILNTEKTHSQRLMPMVDRLLKETGMDLQEIDGFAVTQGPGSFTGLRIGMTTAKTLAWTLGKPLAGIPTLDAIALQGQGMHGRICPILNAKKREIYTAIYQAKGEEPVRTGAYLAIDPKRFAEELAEKDEPVVLLGDAVTLYEETFYRVLGSRVRTPVSAVQLPRASSTAYLGWKKIIANEADDLFTVEPIYIRKSEAEISLEQRCRKDHG